MQILKLGEFEDNFNASSFRFKKSTHQNASQCQGAQLPFERAVLVGGDACEVNLERSTAVQNLPCTALSCFSAQASPAAHNEFLNQFIAENVASASGGSMRYQALSNLPQAVQQARHNI